MSGFEGAIQDLIDQLGALPGIGPKSAQRLAFHLLEAESTEVQELVAAIEEQRALLLYLRERHRS